MRSERQCRGPSRTRATLKAAIRVSAIAFCLLPAACSGDAGKRVAGTAAVGGAIGIPGGPIGIAIGAGVGAAAGAFVPKHVLDGSSQEPGG